MKPSDKIRKIDVPDSPGGLTVQANGVQLLFGAGGQFMGCGPLGAPLGESAAWISIPRDGANLVFKAGDLRVGVSVKGSVIVGAAEDTPEPSQPKAGPQKPAMRPRWVRRGPQ